MEGFKSLPKMQCFKEGGHAKVKKMCGGGSYKKGGEVKEDLAQDKKMIKKAFKEHDKAEHDKSEPTEIKLKKGGRAKKEAGTVKKYKAGGEVMGVYKAKKTAEDDKSMDKAKNFKPKMIKEGGKVGSDVSKEKTKPSGDAVKMEKVKPTGNKKAEAKSGAKEMPNKYKKGGAVKKYADGGGVMGAISDIGTKLKNNIMGTPEQNRIAQQNIDRYKMHKAAEKAAMLGGMPAPLAAQQGAMAGAQMGNPMAAAPAAPISQPQPTNMGAMNPQGGMPQDAMGNTTGAPMKRGGLTKKMNTGGTAC